MFLVERTVLPFYLDPIRSKMFRGALREIEAGANCTQFNASLRHSQVGYKPRLRVLLEIRIKTDNRTRQVS
jgi:gamma-glutamylcysteine synthetase